jgi:hypothetical protein
LGSIHAGPENVRRVFHNGEHNAFTDLIRWRDKFWLTFRSSSDGHMNFSAPPRSSWIASSPRRARLLAMTGFENTP